VPSGYEPTLTRVIVSKILGKRTDEGTPETTEIRGLAETAGHEVVADGELTPTQARNLAEALPDRTAVKDRHRIVLDVFDDRAGTRTARLQVRLAELRYELPRLRAAIRRDEATEYTVKNEEGKEIDDHRRRIDEIRPKPDESDGRGRAPRARGPSGDRGSAEVADRPSSNGHAPGRPTGPGHTRAPVADGSLHSTSPVHCLIPHGW